MKKEQSTESQPSVFFLSVSNRHEVYVEEYGNPKGIPVVFLHGGPGSGCKPAHADCFNKDHYRIILFDQRGAGRSIPGGELVGNQTSNLLEDMEAIRKYLKIDQWLLFGGSWGATLALVYAQTYPDRVTGMILRGTFLARQKDLDWFFSGEGVARIFPQAWNAFSEWLPETEKNNLIEFYYSHLLSKDKKLNALATRAWFTWGDTVVTNGAIKQEIPSKVQAVVPSGLLEKARIEAHYAKHNYFLEENGIIKYIHQLPDVPVSIVHGRHDLVCPFEAAWTLHQTIPGSRLISVDSGHLASEPAMATALVKETERFSSVVY